jgi:uncharacterized protein YajQ (UPF0234 family)
MYDMLCNKLVKRGVDISSLELGEPIVQVKTASQAITVREGIESADSVAPALLPECRAPPRAELLEGI